MKRIQGLLFSILISSILVAESDTLVLNPITWDTPSPDGWNAQYTLPIDFPDGETTWRQILMVQTLKCDSATKGDKYPCGEWDYIWNTLVHVPVGDTTEIFSIGSFVTPYGKRLKLGEENQWEWVYDITDYAPILKGRKKLEVGNNQELLDLKFLFVKGTPVRNVQKVENIYPYGTYKYGPLADDSALTETLIPLSNEAAGFSIKAVISGHGHAGPHNCCEWDSKTHSYYLDGWQLFRWNVWKDCGNNPIYPQGGTWPFDRAGWCPGTQVDEYSFELTPHVTPGDTILLDYGIEPYGKDGEQDGEFRMAHQLFTFGPINFKNDANLIDIMNPSSKGRYSRFNPTLGPPSILIQNTGKSTLYTLEISYGLVKGVKSTYKWNGSLKFMDTERIVLPTPNWRGVKRSQVFYAELKNPNDQPDDNLANNKLFSEFSLPDELPETFILQIHSNDRGRAREMSFSITDSDGAVMVSLDEFNDNEKLSIPVSLKKGHYRFHLHDAMEDGISKHWWYRDEPEKIGIDGSVLILSDEGDTLKSFHPDFGQELLYFFRIGRIN